MAEVATNAVKYATVTQDRANLECGAQLVVQWVTLVSSWNLITYGLVFQTFTIKLLCSRFLRAFACQVFCKHDGVYDHLAVLLLRR